MKRCSKCLIKKEESEFFFKNKVSGKLHSYCKTCKRELDRTSYRTNNDRAISLRASALDSVKRAKNFVKRVKRLGSCTKCGEKRWYTLDFHHVNGKDYNIGALCSRGASIKRIKEELRKCVILCANCHREEHYIKRGCSSSVERVPEEHSVCSSILVCTTR